jgi:hypothetical protein
LRVVSDAGASGTVVRFTLRGLVLFSVSLVAAGGALTFASLQLVARRELSPSPGSLANPLSVDDPPEPKHVPAWGELIVREIELERPEEYVAFDIEPKATAWVFPGADCAFRLTWTPVPPACGHARSAVGA